MEGGGGSHLREHGMEDLRGSFLGLEPDGMTILLLSQHSQCHCSTDPQPQKVLLQGETRAQKSRMSRVVLGCKVLLTSRLLLAIQLKTHVSLVALVVDSRNDSMAQTEFGCR